MTILLAIETSTELATAAVLVDGRLYLRELSGVQTHSQGILPAIQALLKEAGVSLQDCAAIAFGCGPGAFTGIRTACGIVQGLAYGADLPVLPVVSLQAMAEAARGEKSLAEFVCILDARMNEVYWAQYRFIGNAWEVVSAPALARLDDVFPQVGFVTPTYVLGHGVVLPEAIAASADSLVRMPHAAQVATLGLDALQAGLQLPPEQAQPLYLRNKIALTTAEREQAKALV
ncbi:tRNA (adenosine(37)-N6)-threonylcarbamoyltransferase complex dimerization subunit type 1 TsaB [Undibacterium sp. CY18W]|uniref:tRNA (Adenosine(37)-N6)-threonylcarbamoyltransferase complex dimerization subunit type 1 TsaB n=1 Tax=Undibacterium hunanense TaxID=2762292 RepID=A0ABR6ZUK0_9BURK|nr:tRNA (adenosine(37)-N6)-threonylcarbamoyltransferase complex dimerization subunit type 1 TsaB [Undibacterium hunanense]MBC3919479.1 tRNA (adenosine(37)-N6)-threonylcarbamoyltransferase complex dimerization subunit type 1 TsaB [Undibacterium hunanense]